MTTFALRRCFRQRTRFTIQCTSRALLKSQTIQIWSCSWSRGTKRNSNASSAILSIKTWPIQWASTTPFSARWTLGLTSSELGPDLVELMEKASNSYKGSFSAIERRPVTTSTIWCQPVINVLCASVVAKTVSCSTAVSEVSMALSSLAKWDLTWSTTWTKNSNGTSAIRLAAKRLKITMTSSRWSGINETVLRDAAPATITVRQSLVEAVVNLQQISYWLSTGSRGPTATTRIWNWIRSPFQPSQEASSTMKLLLKRVESARRSNKKLSDRNRLSGCKIWRWHRVQAVRYEPEIKSSITSLSRESFQRGTSL